MEWSERVFRNLTPTMVRSQAHSTISLTLREKGSHTGGSQPLPYK